MTVDATWLVCGLLGITMDIVECERDCMRSLAREEASQRKPRSRRGSVRSDREQAADRWLVTHATAAQAWTVGRHHRMAC